MKLKSIGKSGDYQKMINRRQQMRTEALQQMWIEEEQNIRDCCEFV